MWVQVALPGLPAPVLAALDTGAAWTVLEPEIAELLGLFDGSGEVVSRLETPFGPFQGRLERVVMTLLAEEGQDLEVEATVFVCRDWPRENFLGYAGLLERVRFALDPPRRHFHFGAPATF